MEYKVIMGGCGAFSINLEKFEAMVQGYINSGWEPMGGICQNGAQLFQAMIKRKA